MIKWLERNKIYSWIFVILIAIEIFWFSSIVGSPGPSASVWFARLYHFTIFFLFNFFMLTSIMGNRKINLKYFLIVIFISILYAISDEIHQIFVPFRGSSVRDVLTDNMGIFCSSLIYLLSKKKS